MVTVSCITKLWGFALSEQLEKHKMLDNLFTSYAYNKNTIARRFVKRVDKEVIPNEKIHTHLPVAIAKKILPGKTQWWNDWFDRWTAHQIRKVDSKIFVGWSGMSLNSIRAAKRKGMKTVLERGSTHIEVQNRILQEEYKRLGFDFSIPAAMIKKELQEYQEVDLLSVPSFFVKNSFLEQGFPEEKIVVNPFGASNFFKPAIQPSPPGKKFVVLYLGTLSIRKGLIYLFEALNSLKLPADSFEAWFIGSVDQEFDQYINKYKQGNWKFFGHINHYELQQYLTQCDVGVQPSLEEGLSMVIPQMMSCGLPVIVTPNTGGENIITDSVNGFIVPIRTPAAIAEKITMLFEDHQKLDMMKDAAAKKIATGFTWDDYGLRYKKNLEETILI